MPESVPRPVSGGRHAQTSSPTAQAVPGASDVTERLFIPQQYRQPQAAPTAASISAPSAGADLVQRGGGTIAPHQHVGLAMKRRNPVGVWLGLPLITFGIYTYVWYYKIHREMAEFDRRRVAPVAGPVLVLLLLPWTVIAPLVSLFNTGNRIANAQRAAGLRPTCSAGLGLLLCFVFGLVSLYYQSELNKIVDAYGVPEGTEIALRGRGARPRWEAARRGPRRPPRAPFDADEPTSLASWLDFQRATLIGRCDGLDDAQLRTASVPPSPMTLLGLVRHAAEVERNWFRRVLAGEDLPPIFASAPNADGHDGGFDLDEGGIDEALTHWRREVDAARRNYAGRGLDETSPFAGGTVRLRWILTHMIGEYARHNGHADLLRERLDGRTGV